MCLSLPNQFFVSSVSIVFVESSPVIVPAVIWPHFLIFPVLCCCRYGGMPALGGMSSGGETQYGAGPAPTSAPSAMVAAASPAGLTMQDTQSFNQVTITFAILASRLSKHL